MDNYFLTIPIISYRDKATFEFVPLFTILTSSNGILTNKLHSSTMESHLVVLSCSSSIDIFDEILAPLSLSPG